MRLIQFTFIFKTSFFAYDFELYIIMLYLHFELVGLMLLKHLELLGTPLDPLPFVGQLMFFVEIWVVQVLQFIELVLVLDVVIPLFNQV